MNTIVAESLDYCATYLEKATGGKPAKLNNAIQKLLTEIINKHGRVIFNGDGYSEEWHEEAASRGLLNLKTSADALPALKSKEAKQLFKKYGVLSNRELESRLETYLEQYCLSVTVEAKLMIEMGHTSIFPAAVRYQGELAATCVSLKTMGYEFDTDTLDKVTALVKGLQDSLTELEEKLEGAHNAKSSEAEARYHRDKVLPAMLEVRKYADGLEAVVADDMWPLPTYQEMLFIK